MSLRWSERICAALSPTRVNTAVWARGWSREPTERATLRCDDAGGGPRWAPAITGLRGWLASRPASRAGLRVVLSNRFLRYAVLPWHEGLVTREEREAQASHLLRGTYGEAASQWHLKVAETGYGEPALACAVDRGLVEALHGAADEARLRLDAVQPLLMSAFNRFRHDLGSEACLLVLEPEVLCCAVLSKGRWQAVQVSQVGALGWNEALVERQIAVHGLPVDMPVFLFDASASAQPARAGQAYRTLAAPPGGRGDLELSVFSQPA